MTAVVFTGLGAVSAYGTVDGRGVPRLLHGLAEGRPPAFAPAEDPATCPIDPTLLDEKEPRRWLPAAIGEALSGARWPEDGAPPVLLLAGQAPAPEASDNPLYAAVAVEVGPHRWEHPLVISHACASALFAVHFAERLIRSGAHDAVLVAGVSVCTPCASESLRVVKAIGTVPSRPFDRERDGILIGEGAGAVLLERASTALARGAVPLAELGASVAEIGGASSAASDSAIVFDAMTRAIRDAGAPGVDYVHAHATGTVQGDAAEIEAVSRLAAERGLSELPVSSHKGALGHLLHASGFPGLIVAVSAVRDGVLPTTVGLRRPLAADGVDLLVEGPAIRPRRRVDRALVNAFGFGGNNACVLVRRSPSVRPHRPSGFTPPG